MGEHSVHIAKSADVNASVIGWRISGVLRLTVIVKATFALANDGVAGLAAPSAMVAVDRTFHDHPLKSVSAPAETAPYLARCDVVATGFACAPGGRPVSSMSARLALFRDDQPLVDKTLQVVGDRGAHMGAPQPFARMDLVWERALGGPRVEANPVGVAIPNIIDPGAPERPACFGPISRFWPTRKRLVSADRRAGLDAPVATVPEGIDWTYFQCAPDDQRVEPLRGDEWLILEGFDAERPQMRTRLPGLCAAARLIERRAGGREVPIPLAMDMLIVDGERATCAAVWRGSIESPTSEAEWQGLAVLASLEGRGRSGPWVELRDRALRGSDRPLNAVDPAQQPASANLQSRSNDSTLPLAETAASPGARPATPFPNPAPANTPPRNRDLSALPWGDARIPAAPRTAPGEHTLDLQHRPPARIASAAEASAPAAPITRGAPLPAPAVGIESPVKGAASTPAAPADPGSRGPLRSITKDLGLPPTRAPLPAPDAAAAAERMRLMGLPLAAIEPVVDALRKQDSKRVS